MQFYYSYLSIKDSNITSNQKDKNANKFKQKLIELIHSQNCKAHRKGRLWVCFDFVPQLCKDQVSFPLQVSQTFFFSPKSGFSHLEGRYVMTASGFKFTNSGSFFQMIKTCYLTIISTNLPHYSV